MVRVRQKTPGPLGKQRTKPTKQPKQLTVEQLKEAIIKNADTAEALMMKHPRPPFRMNNPFDFPPMQDAKRENAYLWNQLTKQWDDPDEVNAWIDQSLTDPMGAVPRWSRRGSFILWMDYLPMMVSWDGILQPDMTLTAVAPDLSFIRDPAATGRPSDVEKARALPSTGYLGLGCWQAVAPKWNSVVDLAISIIVEKHRNLVLRPLTPEAKRNVQDTLIQQPWIRTVVAEVPRHRMPLPPHLRTIPQTLAFD